MGLLGKSEIYGANDLPTADIDVPEWGGKVRVRTAPAMETNEFERALYKAEHRKNNYEAEWAAFGIVDESGNRIFSDLDAAELGKRSPKALARVFEAVKRLNTLDLEQAAKNSAPTPAIDSGSESQST